MIDSVPKAVRQFISYFFVGGTAAIVEWVVFFIISVLLEWHYILATFIAFTVATTVNWLLGRTWTFRDSTKYHGKAKREAALVFAVSAIGLLFNVLLMYLFVNCLGLDTDFLKTSCKIVATEIVFIWNFSIRKFAIYQ